MTDDQPAQQPRGGSESGSRAVASVTHEDGMWVVHLSVLRPSGVVRRRIRAYPDERRAALAARWMERAANRDIGPRRP